MKPSMFSTLASPLLFGAVARGAGLTEDSFTQYPGALALSASFNPVKAAYWTGYPHHRRTPFALSPNGTVAYLAYLDSSETDVHVQPVDPTTFAATGTVVTVTGAKEAGGLVAHEDGFALLTNEPVASGTANAPAGSTPVAVLYRYDASGSQQWKTFLGGPEVSSTAGYVASPDLNGDLVYSEAAGLYAAYFVVTSYSGDFSGHFGDAIRYVDAAMGSIKAITGASSDWGCSHNTGIAFEAADEVPFASVCAEDQGAVWLNTKGQGMTTAGAKISNENTTNGADGEPLGGMSGSYSGLARLGDTARYIFAWVSRGAVDLTENTWMGNGYTHAANRTNGRNVAIAVLSDKATLAGGEATSEVGAASGDAQVNWLTDGADGADRSNAHVAAFGDADGSALVTWEEIAAPTCDFVAMGCRGEFTGSYFQLVSTSGTGAAVGSPAKLMDTFVAGDMVTMEAGRVCWPYVNMTWSLGAAVRDGSGATTTEMSFACASLSGTGAPASNATTAVSSGSTGAAAASSSSASASSAASAVATQVAVPGTTSSALSAASQPAGQSTDTATHLPSRTRKCRRAIRTAVPS